MSGRTFVDTNVLVYLYDLAEPNKRKRAREVLQAERGSSVLLISTQVLSEVYAALTREKKHKPRILAPEKAERVVRALSNWTVIPVDAPMILEAIATSRSNQLSFWDALVVRAAVTGNCTRLLSEDLNADQSVDGVRIENPFATRRAHAGAKESTSPSVRRGS